MGISNMAATIPGIAVPAFVGYLIEGQVKQFFLVHNNTLFI